MRISNSAVSMASSHEYESRVSESSVSLLFNDKGAQEAFTPLQARMDSFEQSSTFREAEAQERSGNVVRIASAETREVSEQRATMTQNQNGALVELNATPQSGFGESDIRDKLQEMKASVLQKMLDLLHGIKNKEPLTFGELTKWRVLALRSSG